MDIPGYRFDGKRYYKILPGHPARPPAAAPPPPKPAEPSRKKLKRSQQKGKGRALAAETRAWPSVGGLRIMQEGPMSYGSRMRMHHELESLGMSKLQSTRTLYPDCLPIDDDITKISFDSLNSNIVRVGSSSGTIAIGSLVRNPEEDAYYPNDEQGWRSSWFFPSTITSLNTCEDRILATCLGSPAQALVGTTTGDTMSLASVTLSPRKTSLWTGALTKDCIALGCDSKVLTTRDPVSATHTMDGYVTGGRHGGGAVFALDISGKSIFAGTRSGYVKMFDMRSSPTQNVNNEEPRRAETDIKIDSSVTHIKYNQSMNNLVVASMSGALVVYDSRFHQRPLLSLKGHKNEYTRELGFDVWRDEFLAAAGQDGKVRLWSLRNGNLLPPPRLSLRTTLASTPSPILSLPSPEASLLRRQFESPVKALSFREANNGFVELWVGNGGALECYTMEGI